MRRLYGILLRLYPAGFREEYESELERQFSDEYREAVSRRERIRLTLRALVDLAATAPREIAREIGQDLRYAVRIFRQRAVATVLAVVALALAIGATTGIFSVLNALLIRSLPFREPDRLVELWLPPFNPFSGRAAVQEWRNTSPYLRDVAFCAPQPMNLGIGSESLRVTVSETTADFLQLLGTGTVLGRGFSPDEDIPGRNRVAVIGYGLWQQAFGGDHRVLGSVVRLNEVPVTVIGVAPRGFDFPQRTAVWTPSAYQHLPTAYFRSQAIGRLKAGVSFEQASKMFQTEIDRANAGRVVPKAEGYERSPRLFRLQDRLAGPVRPASLVLMGLMVFVLLIACANLAHLLLSRATERRREIAVRAALGASRARLTRQLITEATLLTAAAGLAGLAAAQGTTHLAAIAQPVQLTARQYSVFDWRVLAFALGVAVLTGILFGVLPASLIGRMQPGRDVLRTHPGTHGSTAGRMRGALIALQAALTVALAAGCFSMGRSFLRMIGTDLGYRTGRVVTLRVELFNTWGRIGPYVRDALQRLRSVPGVESAGAAAYSPLVAAEVYEGAFYRLELDVPERSSRLMSVRPGNYRTMGTPIIEGRDFTERDQSGEPVVIVNTAFARAFPDQRLVGKTIFLHARKREATIIGVAGSHHFSGPDSEPWDVIYRPLDQYPQNFATFVARVRGDPESYLAICRDAVQSIDRGVPVFDVKTLDQRLADTLARPRFYTTAIAFLTGFALLAAAIGAYGAASHTVAQRTREIGVRIAVGGPPGRVRGMVFRQSMVPVLIGAIVGLLCAAMLGRYLKHLMASVEPVGIWMCAGAAIAVGAANAASVWIATSRVVRTDPTTALRVE